MYNYQHYLHRCRKDFPLIKLQISLRKFWFRFNKSWKAEFWKENALSIFFISPLLSLTGFSLGMNIFHFEAFPLSAWKSRFQATDLHIFGLVGKALAHRWYVNVYLTLKRDCGLRQIEKSPKIISYHIISSYHHIISYYI
jgi:hypothetical protein